VRGFRACGVRGPKLVIFVPAPARSRGCAEIGRKGREGEAIVFALSPPGRFRVKRFARLLEHEVAHTLGKEHHAMDERTLYSMGGVPDWAKGTTIRYKGRVVARG